MSRAKQFLLGRGKPDAVMFPSPASDDGAGVLYREVLRALRARGLARLHHPCGHCGKMVSVDLTAYPEIRMACADAVGAFVAFVEAECERKEAAAK